MSSTNKNSNFSTPREMRDHKINRGIFLFILIILGIHILCALNTTYDGYSLEKIGGKKHISQETVIQYFGLIPVWVSNIFYAMYIVYGILLVYGVTGIIGTAKRSASKEE